MKGGFQNTCRYQNCTCLNPLYKMVHHLHVACAHCSVGFQPPLDCLDSTSNVKVVRVGVILCCLGNKDTFSIDMSTCNVVVESPEAERMNMEPMDSKQLSHGHQPLCIHYIMIKDVIMAIFAQIYIF